MFLLSFTLCSCAGKQSASTTIPAETKPIFDSANVSKPAADGTRKMLCPAPNLLSSGVTAVKPLTAEQLVRNSVKPPATAGTNEWNINSLAASGANLYLSCYYSNKKILAYKLPLQKELCVAKEQAKNLYVECIKK
jgi:hypothetical protein